jgi:carbon monoxide dehydrogenase subunit G
MKYNVEVIINLPREKVIELFDNPDNLKKWQPGLISFETIEGKPSEVGSIAKLKYKMGKKEIEMVETIILNNLPYEFSGTYETKGVFNIVKNYFIEIDQNSTRYLTEQEFQFKGYMKIIGFLMPGAFKKESMKYLNQFKTFAENQTTT